MKQHSGPIIIDEIKLERWRQAQLQPCLPSETLQRNSSQCLRTGTSSRFRTEYGQVNYMPAPQRKHDQFFCMKFLILRFEFCKISALFCLNWICQLTAAGKLRPE